jgi:hypothetical protein
LVVTLESSNVEAPGGERLLHFNNGRFSGDGIPRCSVVGAYREDRRYENA